jgi:biotin operon repressor
MGYFIVEGEDEQGKYRQLVDDETGEIKSTKRLREIYVEEGNYLYEFDPSLVDERKNQPWFFRIYRTNWMDLILKKRLTTNEIGVLVSLMTFLDWESNYLVHPKTRELLSMNRLAELLRVDRKQLDKTVQSLKDKGLVAITDTGRGRGKKVQLNSHVLYFGEKIRDINEHKVFDDVNYKPVVRKTYRQRKSH